ncbi:MAG: general secretion pathway protein C [Motiliproteus sp.]|jgi:general secretion pathway protein C
MNLQRYLISALVLVLAYQAADLSWKLIAPVAPALTPEASVSHTLTTAGSEPTVDRLIAANLLGSVQAKPATAIVASAPMQAIKTRHAVKLVGILHSPIAAHSVAILLSNNRQAAFIPGDSLKLGSTSRLLQVLQDRVVIEVDGQREYIELLADSGGGKPIRSLERRAVIAESLPTRIDLKGTELEAIVGDYRHKILTDPLSFGRFVQISPQVEGSRVIGYRLNAGRDGRLFQALGLRPGDLVTHVNYLDLSKPENISKLIALVTAGGSASVGIRRGNEQVDIDVEL